MNEPQEPITTPMPWTCDARGYLLTSSGARAARLGSDGTLWLWDKRERCEVPFTLDDWQMYQTMTKTA